MKLKKKQVFLTAMKKYLSERFGIQYNTNVDIIESENWCLFSLNSQIILIHIQKFIKKVLNSTNSPDSTHTEFFSVTKVGKKRLIIKSISKLDEYDMRTNLKGKKQPNIKKNLNSQLITSSDEGANIIDITIRSFELFNFDNHDVKFELMPANSILNTKLEDMIFIVMGRVSNNAVTGANITKNIRRKRKIFKIACRAMIFKIARLDPSAIFFSLSNSIIWFKTKSAILSS